MPSNAPVVVSVAHGIASLELARPRARNRIDAAMAEAIGSAAAAVAQDERVRVVLLSGRGSHFCGGGEVEPAGVGPSPGAAAAIAAIAQPVVAALGGDVFDQGLELALAADIRIASAGARFAMRQLQHGAMPRDGGTQRLPRAVGRGLALDMLLTGRVVDAGEALARGLVTEVVEDGRAGAAMRATLLERAREVASGIAERGAAAGRYAKEAVGRGAEMPFEDGLRLEADLSLLLFGDPERAEGLAAFREKRPPRFG